MKEQAIRWQLLSPSLEAILVDWIVLNAECATPLTYNHLHSFAFELCGKLLTEKWACDFLKR